MLQYLFDVFFYKIFLDYPYLTQIISLSSEDLVSPKFNCRKNLYSKKYIENKYSY